MEKLVVLGIIVVAVVWYFKSKKNKSKNVKDTIQEEFTETCCSKSSEDKVEVKEEDKVEVSLEKYPTELAENLKISNFSAYRDWETCFPVTISFGLNQHLP